MPHTRKRHIESQLRKAMAQSPIVGLIGHRQMGKTTLSELLGGKYLSLDSTDLLQQACENPLSFLKESVEGSQASNPLVIDECQKAPPLFPELKEWVRTRKSPGQFLLTGSVKFTSRKAIQESLTGRIVNLELLPMLISENLQIPLPRHLFRLLQRPVFDSRLEHFFSCPLNQKEGNQAISKYVATGGMPGICFLRDANNRLNRHQEILKTILERDIRQVHETTLPDYAIHRAARYLAESQGIPIRLSQMSRKTEISIPTLQKLLYAFESIFLIRSLPTEGDSHSVVYYFEDFAESQAITPTRLTEQMAHHHLVLLHLRGQALYSDSFQARFFQYSTRGGAIVPIGIQGESCTLGVIPCELAQPERSEKASGGSFLKKYSQSKMIYTHPEAKAEFLNDREIIVPLHWLLV